MTVSPDLRALCRRLAAASPDELPAICPFLVGCVTRSKSELSAPYDAKTKDKASSEAAGLVNRLRTQISTLLAGRSAAGRFVAVVLVKAVIDVGGWECLRSSESWVRGLLSVLQKPDPLPSKQLCIVTLTRIYTLLHGHQTLVREIATPTLPAFASSCLQLSQLPSSGKTRSTASSLAETVANAFIALLPLYPTTLRPSAAQIRSSFRLYIAPTSPEESFTPESLRRAARRVIITLHHTSPKVGGAEEWAKSLNELIHSCHVTADQIFRAVLESWESTTGYAPTSMKFDGEPHSGVSHADDLPPWTGLGQGAQRLSGLLQTISEFFLSPTRIPVATPLDSIIDLASRLAAVVKPVVDTENGESILHLNPSVGREERDELWSSLPDIQSAVLRLLQALLTRLSSNAFPVFAELIDMTVRLFEAISQNPDARAESYLLIRDLILLAGRTLPNLATESLYSIIQSCCHDLAPVSAQSQVATEDAKAKTNGAVLEYIVAPADALLAADQPLEWPKSSPQSPCLAAARRLLPVLLSHLPQQHVGDGHRALLDRTAILTQDKEAMLASCLNPHRSRNGQLYPSTLPFLNGQYGDDQSAELLRSILVPASTRTGFYMDGTVDVEKSQNAGDALLPDSTDDVLSVIATSKPTEPSIADLSWLRAPTRPDIVDTPMATLEELVGTADTIQTSVGEPDPLGSGLDVNPLKRKGDEEEIDSYPAKKADKGKGPDISSWETVQSRATGLDRAERQEHNNDGSDNESVHIDMTLDLDEEDEEDSNSEEQSDP